jgi:hypothetical protein
MEAADYSTIATFSISSKYIRFSSEATTRFIDSRTTCVQRCFVVPGIDLKSQGEK